MSANRIGLRRIISLLPLWALLVAPMAGGARSCPENANAVAVSLTVTARYPSGAPAEVKPVGVGDELLLQLAIEYTRLGPDGEVRAAVQNGRMLLKIGFQVTDVTPRGGVPLIGGDGTPGCDGVSTYKSLFVPYTVTSADAALGYIPVVGVYTNGDAHLGEGNGVGVVSASQPLAVPVASPTLGAATNCVVACVVWPETNRVCAGEMATFTVETTNGTAPYTFIWSGPGEYFSTNVSITLSNVQAADAGVYSVTVTDATGCTNACSASLIVTAPPPLSIFPPSTNVCAGQSATFAAEVGEGTPPFSYFWFGPDDFTSTNRVISLQEVTRDSGGDYHCMVIDGDGCQSVARAELLVNEVAGVLTAQVSAICLGDCAHLDLEFPTGAAPYRVVLEGPDGPVATNVTEGDITVSVCPTALGDNSYLAHITDAAGCTTTCETTVLVTPPIHGPAIVCPQSVNTYSLGRSSDETLAYDWRLEANEAGAYIISSQGQEVQVYSGTNGSYRLRVDIYQYESLEQSCAYLATIVDTSPPTLVCGASLVVSETPRSSGAARVTFQAPLASDNCDPNPAVTCLPAPGSLFSVGETLVTCTAVDDLGNAAECSFTIKVVPFVITVTSAGDTGPGTLRQAFLDANATPGLNVIRFALPGDTPQTIRPLSTLPAIIEPVRIEGTAGPNQPPAIMLDGSMVNEPSYNLLGIAPIIAPSYGLRLLAGGNLVRGLIINNFETGIRVEGEGDNRIEASWFGTDTTGLGRSHNSGQGVVVASSGNVIAGNVISGHHGHGLVLEGEGAWDNTISANRIGLGADGASALGNGGAGVLLRHDAGGNRLGAFARSPGNELAFNGGGGIVLESTAGSGNHISRNSMGAHAALGIDLGADGSTPNDLLDADSGPNAYQNHPELGSVRSDTRKSTIVQGVLSSRPSRSFTLEFLLQPAGESATFAQGQTFLGEASVITDESGLAEFMLEFQVAAVRGQAVVATATDSDGNTSEFSPAVEVQTPPETSLQPASTTVPTGGSVTLCVEVNGLGPFIYQWRREGRNIPGETNQCITVRDFQAQLAGTYTVVVANDAGAVISGPAALFLEEVPRAEDSDLFASRSRISGFRGLLLGSNLGATSEGDEPEHYARPAHASIWYTWTSPSIGIATFTTVGSTFDTVLAVYVGSSLSNLVEVASDDDRGGFLSSRVQFNALPGFTYHIVVDGFGGAAGSVLLGWELDTTLRLLPTIFAHPLSLISAPGAPATFTVDATRGCKLAHHDCRWHGCQDDDEDLRAARESFQEDDDDHGHDYHFWLELLRLRYQWFLNGQAIPGATNTNYVVSAVSEEFVGEYTVQVTRLGRTVESRPARLQINLTGEEVQNVFAADKAAEAFEQAIVLGGFNAPQGIPGLAPPDEAAMVAAATVVRGYTGTQVINTANGGTEPNDVPICGVIGGASVWVTFLPQDSGVLHLNTDGSTYNTVMGVFIRSPLNPAILQLVDCDNNSGRDGRDSALSLPVQAGVTNFVMIDGVNGATGTLRLNYSLVTSSSLIALGRTPQGHVQVRVSGHPAMRFLLEASSDFTTWASLLTTNAATGTFDFIDTGSLAQPRRVYRARMLP